MRPMIIRSPISRRFNFTIGDSLEIMVKYSHSVTAVLVRRNQEIELNSCGEYVYEIILGPDTKGCFILYPPVPNEPGEVLACEVSTYTVDDAGRRGDLVLQTIADRDLINECKLMPGYLKKLKFFTAPVPVTPRSVGHDVELCLLDTKIYCRSRCIEDSKFWSPAVDYIPDNTTWNGGSPQLVCIIGDNEEIQLLRYDTIYEIESGIYLFTLGEDEPMDIIWNTLPIEKEIQIGDLNNLVIQPVSFLIIPSTPSKDLKLIDEEYFKSQDKRAMSLATYYRNELIQARAQIDKLRRVNELAVSGSMPTRCETLSGESGDKSSRKRSRENIVDEVDDQANENVSGLDGESKIGKSKVANHWKIHFYNLRTRV